MRTAGGIVAVALSVAVAALIVGAIIRVPDEALIELLRLVFSWPSVAALLGGIVLLNFHKQIGEYIQRIGNIEATTSGLKLMESQRQQPVLTPASAKGGEETAPLSSEQQQELAQVREQFEQLERDVAGESLGRGSVAGCVQRDKQPSAAEGYGGELLAISVHGCFLRTGDTCRSSLDGGPHRAHTQGLLQCGLGSSGSIPVRTRRDSQRARSKPSH